jgi:AcrR family transcriptional regulator
MTAIADAAGVSRQTVYNHHPNVESIVTAAIETHEEQARVQLEQLLTTAPNAPAKLDLLIRHGLAIAAHGHVSGPTNAGLSAASQAHLQRHREAHVGLVADVLVAGIQEGSFRADLQPQTAARLIHQMLVGGVLPQPQDDLAASADAAIALIRRGIAA